MGERMLVRAAGWLYRKLGPRYLVAYLGWELVSALLIALGTVGIFSLYQRMSDSQLHAVVLFSWGAVLRMAYFAFSCVCPGSSLMFLVRHHHSTRQYNRWWR